MYNVHKEMVTFFTDHVRITQDKLDQLKDYRDKSVKRLRSGLESLGYSSNFDDRNQGSYAMHTMIQHREGDDYDIDVAVVFHPDDLPSTSFNARQRVCDGAKEGGGNFKKDPERRVNAVTVWYADGYHVDFPVFREHKDDWGRVVREHAGTAWTPRNPVAITEWFKNAVDNKSPKEEYGATVKPKQMRRLVRLLKMFAKSRDSWNLAGGLIITVLVEEQYCADYEHDDRALYNTMFAIYSRLQFDLDVYNPTESGIKLNDKDERTNQIARFRDKLELAIKWLAPLFDSECDDETAYNAWNKVFNHEYWQTLLAHSRGSKLGHASKSGNLYVSQTGLVTSSKPEGKSLSSPSHRFFGEDDGTQDS